MNKIYYIDTQNESKLKNYLFGLIVECPMGGNPPHCVFHNIRNRPLKKRFEWIKQMTHSNSVKIFLDHKKCISEKENQVYF